jgi:hypothetical protein
VGWGRRWEEVRDAHAKAQVLGGGCWVGDGGAWDGIFFFLSLFEQGRECATATRSKCTGSKKDGNTVVGLLVSYDGTEPSPGWERRVVGGIGGLHVVRGGPGFNMSVYLQNYW